MQSDSWPAFLQGALKHQDAQGQRRRRGNTVSGNTVSGNTVSGNTVSGEIIDFGSNDYLGLCKHPALLAIQPDEASWGSGASPVLGGHSQQHRDLEQRLAELCGFESALVFSSGYACNAGAIPCLVDTRDAIFSDELVHASLIDGCRLSRASRSIFPHNDVEYLANCLRQTRHQFVRVLVITESIFSMDGDQARLRDLAELCATYECGLVVDEAHATGVYGTQGGGLVQELALEPFVLGKLGTLSKAVGSIGGFACGSSDLIEYFVNHCRSYIFSTAPPPAVMQVTRTAIELLASMHETRTQLRQTSSRLRAQLQALGWNVPQGDSPIVPLIVGTEANALRTSQALQSRGYYVPAIRPPTVPAGQCRLRVSLSASHSQADVDGLISALAGLS